MNDPTKVRQAGFVANPKFLTKPAKEKK